MELAMDPFVSVDPERCICLIGPGISAACLPSPSPTTFTYKGMVDSGIRKLIEAEAHGSGEERVRRETLLWNAYELEPVFAANKIAESLRFHGLYEQWIGDVFSSVRSLQLARSSSSVLDHLATMRDKGALLAYTHYDTVLSSGLGLAPVLLENEDGVKQWAMGRTSGLLYLHGVHSLPGEMKWDCLAYPYSVGDSPGARLVKELCRTRTVVCIGFDGEYFDPFLPKFASVFCAHSKPPLVLASGVRPSGAAVAGAGKLLTLRLNDSQLPVEKVLRLADSSSATHVPDNPASLHFAMFYVDTALCLAAADAVKNLSSISATNILITKDQFHQLAMSVDRPSLIRLWRLLFGESMASLANGLLGVSFEGGPVVWLRSTGRTVAEHQTAVRPDHPTLNTAVSVISSLWSAPIPSPSVSKHSSSVHPTLSSPFLVPSTVGTRQPSPELPRHISLLHPGSAQKLQTQLSRPHQPVRRAQSDLSRLSYHDRTFGDVAASTRTRELQEQERLARKNGVLIHQESAPTFLYTSEASVAYPSDVNSTRLKKVAVSSPAPLIKMVGMGKVTEHTIEYIDQFMAEKAAAAAAEREGEPERAGQERPEVSEEDFDSKRLQYISEAREWSSRLNVDRMQKLAVPGGGPVLGLAGVGGCSPVSFTQDDQERLLKKHFESTSPASAHMLTLPLSTWPVDGRSRSPHTSPRPSPNPLPLPFNSSQKNSPLNPYLVTPSTANMLAFLGSTPTSLPGAGAGSGFLCPSTSPYTAAMLHPFQAAMQMVSPQSGKPVIVTDASVLQNIQAVYGDKLLYMMPDGSITTLPSAATPTIASMFSDPTQRFDGERREMVSPVKSLKRSHSPGAECEWKAMPLPKRRRSSSLPDISKIPERERESLGEEEQARAELEEEVVLRARATQPPNMIHLPKSSDPLLGFPTPGHQGSPLIHPGLAASPLTICNLPFRHQPLTPTTPGQDRDEINDIVEAGPQTNVPSSPDGGNLPPFPVGRGPIQLWQFLLDLLLTPEKKHMIHWTGNGYEFRILQPEEIAKHWGARKNKPKMNYDKLSRGLRYYYSKGIMDKVPGKKLTFKYTCDVLHYIRSRGRQAVQTFNSQAVNSDRESPVEPVAA